MSSAESHADPSVSGSGFSITVLDQTPPSGRVVVTGELDLLTSPQLETALVEMIRKSSLKRVVADLTNVTFFDSSALNVLLQVQRQVEEHDSTLAIVPSRQVRRVMELAGVVDHLELVENTVN